jgi:Ni/Co efflux regulator RcnB
MNRALVAAACLSLLLPGLARAEERPKDAAPAHEAARPAAHEAPHAAAHAAPRPAVRHAAARPAAHHQARPTRQAVRHTARPTQQTAHRPATERGAAEHSDAGHRPAGHEVAQREGAGGGDRARIADASRPQQAQGDRFFHRGHSFARIEGPAYQFPRGYGYRRWEIGALLPAIFYEPAEYYGGWAPLGLQSPPPGYQWVRYGQDLMLVNIDTGTIEDVVYGVFA